MNETRISEAASIEAAVRKSIIEPRGATLTTPDGAHVELLLIPNQNGGVSFVEPGPFVDKHRTAPIRRKGTARLLDLASFIAHSVRFADSDSAVFVSGDKTPSFTTVFDYHRIGSDGGPRFGEHHASFAPVLSPEWLAWTGRHKAPMSQGEFGEFIDSHLADLVDAPEEPTGLLADFAAATGAKFASKADIVGISQEFTLRSESTIKGMTRLSTGETHISYEEVAKGADGKDLRVPQAFVIAIPVFKFGPLIRIPARLRFRKRETNVAWHFDLFEADRAFEAEVSEMIARVAGPPNPALPLEMSGTGLPVYRGSPEA
jgi:hypothetical protein